MELWNILPHPSPAHVVRLFAKKGEEKRGDFARSEKELERFIRSNIDYNTYVAPNPTLSTIGLRHNSNDVTHWSFVFSDVHWVEAIADPRAALYEILMMFGGWAGRNLEKNYPTVIDSGRGVQAWLRTEDLEFTDSSISRRDVRRIMSYWLRRLADRIGLIHGCKLDTSVSDLPRVMRVPGTKNIKTGASASVITTQREPYPWLIPFLIKGCPDSVLIDPEIIVCPGVQWQLVFTKLTPTAQDYIHKGQEEPGRHKTLWHTAKCFAELGVERHEARKALLVGNGRRGKAEEVEMKDIEHILDTAYGE